MTYDTTYDTVRGDDDQDDKELQTVKLSWHLLEYRYYY